MAFPPLDPDYYKLNDTDDVNFVNGAWRLACDDNDGERVLLPLTPQLASAIVNIVDNAKVTDRLR